MPAETIRAAQNIQAFSNSPSSERLACTRVSCDEEVGIPVVDIDYQLSVSFCRPDDVRKVLPYAWRRESMEARIAGNFVSGAALAS